MIKTLLFDIDGVLFKTKRLHKIAFIQALNRNGISLSEEQHDKELDGLPTVVKLDRLGVQENKKQDIFDLKQKITFERARNYIGKNEKLINMFRYLNEKGYSIGIGSNAIREFCELSIELLGVMPYVGKILSNNDVSKTKPDPEIYIKLMEYFGSKEWETLIFEDSKFGLEAAFQSGAYVCFVKNPRYLTRERIIKYIDTYKEI